MKTRLTRRSFTGSMLAVAQALLLGQRSSTEKYNVLFIASDDLNNSLGCYGHPIVKSPNLDRLATRGVRFDRAYCQFPLCGPSRTSILSGMRPDTTKIWQNEIAVRDTMPDAITLPQLFRQSGYTSARFGKMYHMNVPASVGKSLWDDPPSWDVAVSPAGLENTTPGTGRNITPSHSAGNAMHWISFSGSDVEQADAKAAEDAIAYIDQHEPHEALVHRTRFPPAACSVAPVPLFDLYPLSRISPVRNPVNDRDDIPAASEKTITPVAATRITWRVAVFRAPVTRRAGGGPPVVEPDGHLDLVGPDVTVERRGDDQVREPAVEGHGRDHGDVAVPGRPVEIPVKLGHRRLFGRDVQVVGAGRDGSARQRQAGGFKPEGVHCTAGGGAAGDAGPPHHSSRNATATRTVSS